MLGLASSSRNTPPLGLLDSVWTFVVVKHCKHLSLNIVSYFENLSTSGSPFWRWDLFPMIRLKKKWHILLNFTDLPDWEMRAKDNNWMGRHKTSDEGDWKIFPCKIYTIVISRVNTDALCWAHLVDFSCKTHPVYSKLCKRFFANLNLNKFSLTFE